MAPFLLHRIHEEDEAAYWQACRRELGALDARLADIDRFNDFVMELFDRVGVTYPSDGRQAVRLAEALAREPVADFLLLEFPRYVRNMGVAIDAMARMQAESHRIYRQFLQERGAPERLLDLFIPVLWTRTGFFPAEYWQLRLLLCELLGTLLLERGARLLLFDRLVSVLFARVVVLVEASPALWVAGFVRVGVQLVGVSGETARKRAVRILKASSGTLARRYAMAALGEQITRPELLKLLVLPGDLDRLGSLAAEGYLKAFRCLCRVWVLDPLYGREAGHRVRLVLRGARDEVLQWFVILLRRVVAFIVVAYERRRYRRRARRLAEGNVLEGERLRHAWAALCAEAVRLVPGVREVLPAPNLPSGEDGDRLRRELDGYRGVILKSFPFDGPTAKLLEARGDPGGRKPRGKAPVARAKKPPYG